MVTIASPGHAVTFVYYQGCTQIMLKPPAAPEQTGKLRKVKDPRITRAFEIGKRFFEEKLKDMQWEDDHPGQLLPEVRDPDTLKPVLDEIQTLFQKYPASWTLAERAYTGPVA
jgi:hypothetical protein